MCIRDRANTNPTISTVETLKEVLESASRENIHIKSVATITENFDGQHLTDFQGLLAAGAAVSYTHLDVYKRQVLGRYAEEFAMGDRILVPFL